MKKQAFLIPLLVTIILQPNFSQLKVKNTGKVIIGPDTTYADYSLNITGSGSIGSGGKIGFGDNSGSTLNVLVGEYGTNNTDKLFLHGEQGIRLSTTDSLNSRLSIAQDGDVGIGTTDPVKKLHVSDETNRVFVRVGGPTSANGSLGDIMIYPSDDNSVGGIRYWDMSFRTDTFGGYEGDLIFYAQEPDNDYITPLKLQADGDVVLCHYNNDSLGAVGIGRKDPQYLLDVDGYIRCVDITETSDSTFKINIDTIPTNKINALFSIQGKQYKRKPIESTHTVILPDSTRKTITRVHSDDRTHFGLLAQEVRNIYPDLVYEDSKGILSIRFSGFIPLIIEALKEQKSLIEELQLELDSLKNDLKSETTKSSSTEIVNEVYCQLFQNNPNPFSENTEIKVFIPESIGNSSVLIFDMQGKPIRSFSVYERGISSILIYGYEMNPGMYLYSLIADGKEIDTKRMILTE
jgi:hypothetical protein